MDLACFYRILAELQHFRAAIAFLLYESKIGKSPKLGNSYIQSETVLRVFGVILFAE